jgi:serine phosphatase RsbU (regulator of sigma subunit)
VTTSTSNNHDWQQILQNSVQDEPHEWLCNKVHGGTQLSAEPFQVPGMRGQLLSIPYLGSESSGDIHYITVCKLGTYTKFLILDVSGHGPEAGALADKLYAELHRLIDDSDNEQVLASINHLMLEMKLLGKFATAFLATYNSWFRSWTFTCAGHHPMLICKQGVWQPMTLDPSVKNIPIGVLGEIQFKQQTIWLDHGDRLLLFSDSLTEIKMSNGKLLGEEGLIRLLSRSNHLSINQQFTQLLNQLSQLNQGQPFNDDLTCFLLDHQPKKWTWWARQACHIEPFKSWCWKWTKP